MEDVLEVYTHPHTTRLGRSSAWTRSASSGWPKPRHRCQPRAAHRVDFAEEVRDLLEARHPHAEKVVLVMDNLNTHKPAALYQAFEPAVARAL